jgi:phage tail protein X
VSDIVEGTAGKAAGAFTKKIGPLPGWAWVLIIVAIAYAAFLWRKRGTASTAAPVTTPAAVGFSSAGPAPGTNNYSGQVDTLPVGQPGLSTNAQWAKRVTDFLVGTGSYSPADVSNAISNFISGNSLNDQQTAIVNTAVKQFQTPPEGVLPVRAGPAFVGHKYTAQAGDTLDSILERFYGRSSAVDARLVRMINPALSGGAIAAGTVVALPTTGIAGVQSNTLNTYDTAPPADVSLSDIGRPITIVNP